MAEIGKFMVSVAGTFLSFGSMGVVGWVAVGIFSIVVGIGGYMLTRWARQYRIDEANRKTDESRVNSSAQVASGGHSLEHDSEEAANEIDRLGRKP